MASLAAPLGPQPSCGQPRRMVGFQPAAAVRRRHAKTGGASMTSPSGNERTRGAKESRQQLEALRERWPLAFPIKHLDVRPLAASADGVVAATMGWSTGYTRGVLFGWKMMAAYCRAVLSHDQRIALDGALAEPVDAKAKDLAAKRLAQIAAKAAKKAAVMARPKPAAPLAAPAPLRDQVNGTRCRRRGGGRRARAQKRLAPPTESISPHPILARRLSDHR